ncbi:hypothetical protein [Mesorhizobium sp. LjRoot246]|uniref:hypothetical protein n=1 Tax=Mesorhizobium sp. LjRoot246 TaxID=3342294 RepID=UPI003ECF0E01
MSTRNRFVEEAVSQALGRVDAFIDGERLARIPKGDLRAVLDAQLGHGSNSVRLASLFFTFYQLQDAAWDFSSIPIGIRGKWGDKRLANELNLRHIALHNSITAFGENLGWKGNVSAARLKGDNRFNRLAGMLESLAPEQRATAADYMAYRFAETRQLVAPLPPVGADVLTYARARLLFYRLIGIPSEGNVQQFLIAGFLHVHRRRFGHEIRTHHVHASDKFDATFSDIEEFREDVLVSAYEVTVRPDWKNRVSDFRAKMHGAGLRKYIIIASGVNSDDQLATPTAMLRFIEPYAQDIAVVDILDVINVFSAELSADELRQVVNQTYSFLASPTLCGRADIIERYTEAVSEWLDSIPD